MRETMITARLRPDGTVVQCHEDGSETPFPPTPLRPMTEAEVSAAAAADPDTRPMSPDELASARRVPRLRTLSRALGLAPEDLSARYHEGRR